MPAAFWQQPTLSGKAFVCGKNAGDMFLRAEPLQNEAAPKKEKYPETSPKMFRPGSVKHRQVFRIWTLRIWSFRGPGFRSVRQVFCGEASRLLLDHFSKHLSSVLGRTELFRNVHHHLSLFNSVLEIIVAGAFQHCSSPTPNQSSLSGDTFSTEAPQNHLRTRKEYSKNISSGKEVPFTSGSKLLRTFFGSDFWEGGATKHFSVKKRGFSVKAGEAIQ